MRKAIILFSALLFLAADWPQEPKAFRGIAFGASERDVASTLKLDAAVMCLDMDEQRSCIHHTSIGEVKVMEIYQFEEDRLVQVFLSFKSPQYSLLLEEFTKLYGKPAERWTEPYETVGGKHTTEILEWRGDRMVVHVEQFGASLHEGIAVVATREWFEKSESD
jgi:hypothetical protein